MQFELISKFLDVGHVELPGIEEFLAGHAIKTAFTMRAAAFGLLIIGNGV